MGFEGLLTLMQALPALTDETLIFLVSGLIGMLGHYLKRRFKDGSKASLTEHFGTNNPLASLGTFLTYSATMTGMLMGFDLATVSTIMVLLLGFLAGYTIDSSVNSVNPETLLEK